VFLDAGGVIILPDRHRLAAALAGVGIQIDPAAVPRAHYRAVRALDRAPERATRPPSRPDYPAALFPQLGIVAGRAAEALAVWERLADRRRTGAVLWNEPTPGAAETIAALRRAGLAVVIVTNSDGHGEENLRDAGVCQVGNGAGATVAAVIDSTRVGSAKPDPGIFEVALARVGARPDCTTHVGDMLTNDVIGARRVGIIPIHFDPYRRCRATDHRHIRSLAGLWQHIGGGRRARRVSGDDRTGGASLIDG
jgi:putative hydrolase of the HAD superfamily